MYIPLWNAIDPSLYGGAAVPVIVGASLLLTYLGSRVLLPRPRDLNQRCRRYVTLLQEQQAQAEPVPMPLAAPQRRGTPVAVVITDADALQEPIPGWVVDRSMDGLCLELDVARKVAAGTMLGVRPVDAPLTIPRVMVSVHSCQKVKQGWELDCQFVRTPPWSVRMLFG